jgi:hypothetical protein
MDSMRWVVMVGLPAINFLIKVVYGWLVSVLLNSFMRLM